MTPDQIAQAPETAPHDPLDDVVEAGCRAPAQAAGDSGGTA